MHRKQLRPSTTRRTIQLERASVSSWYRRVVTQSCLLRSEKSSLAGGVVGVHLDLPGLHIMIVENLRVPE